MKYGSDAIEKKFYILFPKHKDYKLAVLLVLFYLVINWNKMKEIRSIYEYLKNNNLFKLEKDRKFEDREQNQCYFFNKMFIEYLVDLTREARVVFALKQEQLKSSKFVEMILQERVSFEGLHYFLRRISRTMRVLNILWKLNSGSRVEGEVPTSLHHEKGAISVFDYVIEAIS